MNGILQIEFIRFGVNGNETIFLNLEDFTSVRCVCDRVGARRLNSGRIEFVPKAGSENFYHFENVANFSTAVHELCGLLNSSQSNRIFYITEMVSTP